MPTETLLQISLFLRRNIPVAVNKSQLYLSSQPHPTTLLIISLFAATCFGSKCEPLSGLS